MTTQECEHLKRMIVNNVLFCLACKEWLWSGRCSTCRKPLDEHDLVGVEVPVCPKAVTP